MTARNDLEHKQLEAFAAVMTTGSVTAAARMLQRSQPAVTRLIQEMEASIGYPLFVRSGPRVTPTEQAFLLYEYVEQALVSLKQIQTRADEIAKGEERPLVLSATPAIAAGLLPLAISMACSPGLVQIRSEPAEHTVHAVMTGAADLGISSLPLEHRGVQVHWLGQSACVAVMQESDELATQDRIALKQFQGRKLITLHNPYRLRRRFDEALEQQGVLASTTIETNSSINILSAVRAGLGIALMEPVSAFGVPLQGVAVRHIDVDIPFYFGVISLENKPLSPLAHRIIQSLLNAAKTLLPDFKHHDACKHGQIMLLS